MVVVVKLVGMEVREYKGQDGKQHTFCGLHLVHLEDSVRGVKGSKVESVSCPRDIDPEGLIIGMTYQLEYEVYDTKNGKAARLVDMLEVET